MLKKILLLSTIIFTSNLATAASFAEKEEQQRIAAGKIHGIFNLYQDMHNQLAITKAKKLDVSLTSEQAINIIKDYSQGYRKQKTTEQKAQFVYQFMQEVAVKADYTAFQKKDHNENHLLNMTVFIHNLNGGHSVNLVPAKDMNSVFPRLLALIKTQNKVSVNKDSISNKYYENFDDTMPGLFSWPQGEDWYGSWSRWVTDELYAICYTNDGERLCSDWTPDRTHDYDGDGIPEEVCGEYSLYTGGGDSHLHCVGNNS